VNASKPFIFLATKDSNSPGTFFCSERNADSKEYGSYSSYFKHILHTNIVRRSADKFEKT
jgi:hypothetical protein